MAYSCFVVSTERTSPSATGVTASFEARTLSSVEPPIRACDEAVWGGAVFAFQESSIAQEKTSSWKGYSTNVAARSRY
jgi:hypothetical protein